MRTSKTWVRFAAGAAIATGVAAAWPTTDAVAKGTRQNRGGVLRVTDIDVGSSAGVPLNHIVNIYFTQQIDPASVNTASVRVRSINATGTGYTIEVPGTYQVQGSVVRFYPRLPTHLRDPNPAANGGFYGFGSPRDDAYANAGFQPSRNYRITVIGNPPTPGVFPVRSVKGRILERDYAQKFTTAPDSPKSGPTPRTPTRTRLLRASTSRTPRTRSRARTTTTRATAARRTCRAPSR
jgi:hypothetical protein